MVFVSRRNPVSHAEYNRYVRDEVGRGVHGVRDKRAGGEHNAANRLRDCDGDV